MISLLVHIRIQGGIKVWLNSLKIIEKDVIQYIFAPVLSEDIKLNAPRVSLVWNARFCFTLSRQASTSNKPHSSVSLTPSHHHLVPDWSWWRLQPNNHRSIQNRKWKFPLWYFKAVWRWVSWYGWIFGLRGVRTSHSLFHSPGVWQRSHSRTSSREWRHHSHHQRQFTCIFTLLLCM